MSKECKICHMVFDDAELLKYNNICPICHSNNSFEEEYIMDIKRISTDESFIKAMIELHEKDPIEYQLKLSQFKTQLQQQTQPKESTPALQNVPKCPTCGSTDVEKISLGKKVVGGALFGLFSSNVRKTMHCRSCGYKW